MAIEQRKVGKEIIEWDTVLGGPIVHHKDPERVEGGKKAARTRKHNEESESPHVEAETEVEPKLSDPQIIV